MIKIVDLITRIVSSVLTCSLSWADVSHRPPSIFFWYDIVKQYRFVYVDIERKMVAVTHMWHTLVSREGSTRHTCVKRWTCSSLSTDVPSKRTHVVRAIMCIHGKRLTVITRSARQNIYTLSFFLKKKALLVRESSWTTYHRCERGLQRGSSGHMWVLSEARRRAHGNWQLSQPITKGLSRALYRDIRSARCVEGQSAGSLCNN